jgi:hypothetical protein
MKPLKNVIEIAVISGLTGKPLSILKAMHMGHEIEIYEDPIDGHGRQTHLATLPIYPSEWNRDLDDQAELSS